jgi:ABC-type cobalamin/Fe3+-siderophores transport system ATPase subunit
MAVTPTRNGTPADSATAGQSRMPTHGSVDITSLDFSYGRGGHRLRDVSVRVHPGEVCALLGPNGAGKTTLLRCLLGLLAPDRGTITLAGSDLAALSRRELARLVAYVPQTSSTVFPFTTLDMVVMGRTPHLAITATPSPADQRAAHSTLARLGIDHLASRAFAQLSGGERQLALIARALVQQAPVLVLDEPTAALDYGNEVRILTVLTELAAAGHTVLMTTHQPGHALTYATRAVLMRAGAIVADGPPEQIITSDRLTDLYGTPIHVAQVTLPSPDPGTAYACIPIVARRPANHCLDNKDRP